MKIHSKEIKKLVKEQVEKQRKKLKLEARIKSIKEQLNSFDNQMAVAEPDKDKESLFDVKPGEMIILSFEGVTIKVQRQLDDLFKVVDASESAKLKEGDYIKAQGNDSLERGKKFTFSVLRQIDLPYKTNSLIGWKVIKN